MKQYKDQLKLFIEIKEKFCLAGSRLLVQESVYEQFLEKFVAAVKRIKVGDPLF